MNWYFKFCKDYLGVKFDMTFIDFMRFAWVPFSVMGFIMCLIITNVGE